MNIPKKYEDVVAELNGAPSREAALREELYRFKRLRSSFLNRVLCERDAAEQRLTEAELYVQKMIDCSQGQDSIATGYLADILAVIKGDK